MEYNPTIDALIQRIERLESAARRSRITTIALALLFLAAASVATVTAQSAATQTMQHLRIVDANGVERVDIDQNGIALADQNGHYRTVLGFVKDTTPFLEMRAPDHTSRFVLFGDATGPFLRMRDGNGTERVYLGSTTGDTSQLEFKSSTGKKQVALTGDARGSHLSIADEGTRKAYFGIFSNDMAGGVHTFNGDGTSRWYSP